MARKDENKNVTSIDVARYAGVSQSSVSRAFSPTSKLSEKTRQRILAAARNLGYQPNAIARSLVSSQTNTIAVVKGLTHNPMFSDLLTAIALEIQKTDYHIIYYETNHEQTLDSILPKILQYRVEGLILLYTNLSSEITKACEEMNIPVLQMLRYSTNAQANVVLPSNEYGAAMAADLFIKKGYRYFAYVTGEMNSSSNMERQLGFVTRLRDCGAESPIIVQGNYTYKSGYQALAAIAASAAFPCGILCANDLMGLGIIDAAKELNLNIPEEIGVIGFDNNFMSDWPNYGLTSLQQPTDEMAMKGVELLFKSIENPETPRQTRRYNFNLVQRSSTDRKGI